MRLSADREDGFTLVELMIVMSLMLVILAATLASLTSIERGQAEVNNRGNEVAAERVAVARLTRELRQGFDVALTGTNQVSVTTYVRLAPGAAAVKRLVTYRCAVPTCTRQVGTGTASVIATNVTNADVFSLSGSYLGVKLVLALRKGSATILDGVGLRNKVAM